jgi:hypothetical protein
MPQTADIVHEKVNLVRIRISLFSCCFKYADLQYYHARVGMFSFLILLGPIGIYLCNFV